MEIYIKNMVCIRCKMIVKDELEKLGIIPLAVTLGVAELKEPLSISQERDFKIILLRWGLELMDDSKSILIEKIKTIIIELIHYSAEPLTVNFSTFLSQQLHYNYMYLANLFSEAQGVTIEQFIISHKIECVKELIVYNELNLTEIACKMHYSSVQHLSKQFKKITGLTPSHFKQLNVRSKRR